MVFRLLREKLEQGMQPFLRCGPLQARVLPGIKVRLVEFELQRATRT